MTRFLLSGVLLLLATVGSSPSTNVLAEKVKPIALTATISMHSSETNNVDTNEEVTVPEDSADGFKPPKIPKAEQSSQINRKGNKLGGKKKMNYAKRIGTTQSAAESHPTAFYNQNKRPRGERGGVNRDSEDAVATTEAKPDEGGGGSSPARIIPSNKDIVEEELALVQDEKELLLLMEEKAQKEASRDQRTRGEVSNLLEGTQKKDGKIGTRPLRPIQMKRYDRDQKCKNHKMMSLINAVVFWSNQSKVTQPMVFGSNPLPAEMVAFAAISNYRADCHHHHHQQQQQQLMDQHRLSHQSINDVVPSKKKQRVRAPSKPTKLPAKAIKSAKKPKRLPNRVPLIAKNAKAKNVKKVVVRINPLFQY